MQARGVVGELCSLVLTVAAVVRVTCSCIWPPLKANRLSLLRSIRCRKFERADIMFTTYGRRDHDRPLVSIRLHDFQDYRYHD